MTATRSTGRNEADPRWDRGGLPGWAYHDGAFLELEKRELFATHWQIAGHVSDIPKPGDYLTFDVGDERALVVHGGDGTVRGFHNLCRHRGSRVAADERGHCGVLVCPFHGWTYNLDGTLRGAARAETFPALDKTAFGLTPLDLEIWKGFIFVRFKPGPQPSVAMLLAPFEAELERYRPLDVVPSGSVWSFELPVNWKSFRDVDNEGYHVAVGHPGLNDLYGDGYRDIPCDDGISCSKAFFNERPSHRWSNRHYRMFTGGPAWLPEACRGVWAYYYVFPNNVIVATPETIQFYQELPLTVDATRIRGTLYRRPVETREEAAARYLSYRIDRETYGEDTQLAVWSNESMKSSAFRGFLLSDLERNIRIHHDRLRAVLPVVNRETAPAGHQMAEMNSRLLMRAESHRSTL